MRKLAILIVLAVCGCAWGVTVTYYMSPTAEGNGTGVDASNDANSFAPILADIRNSQNYADGTIINIQMATGNYVLAAAQDYWEYNDKECGLVYNINSQSTAGVILTAGASKQFNVYYSYSDNDTDKSSYTWNSITFNYTSPVGGVFLMGADAGSDAGVTWTFNNCAFNVATAGEVIYFNRSTSNATFTFNNCSYSGVGRFSSMAGPTSFTIVGGTYTNSGTSSLIQLGGTAKLYASGGATFSRTNITSTAAPVIAHLGTGSLTMDSCTITADPNGYGDGISVGVGVATYAAYVHIKHTDIYAPVHPVNLAIDSRHCILDGYDSLGNMATIANNAPTRFEVSGTWAADDTIQIWIQDGVNTSSFIFTVTAGRTSTANIAADFATAWNLTDGNGADAFCKSYVPTVTASSSTIILYGTSRFTSQYATVTHGGAETGTVLNHASAGYSPQRPSYTVYALGRNAQIKNYIITSTNGSPWEGVSLTAADPDAEDGRSNGVYNCRITGYFPIAIRASGEIVENCVLIGQWPLLIEHGANNNVIKNCTAYAIQDTYLSSGGFIWAYVVEDTGKESRFTNNIVVAASAVNAGSGSLPTTTVYCLIDTDNKGAMQNFFDYNCYWTIGESAKIAKVSNTEYDANSVGFANLKSMWGALSGTPSALNDVHSIYADPQFKETTYYSLNDSSPCIGAGMPYVGGDKPFIGAVPPKAHSMMRGRAVLGNWYKTN